MLEIATAGFYPYSELGAATEGFYGGSADVTEPVPVPGKMYSSPGGGGVAYLPTFEREPAPQVFYEEHEENEAIAAHVDAQARFLAASVAAAIVKGGPPTRIALTLGLLLEPED